MRTLKTILFIFSTLYFVQAQDGLKIKLGLFDEYHIHQNANGSNMFEVLEDNTFFGIDAGNNNDRTITEGRNNTFLGSYAGKSNSDGAYNTFIGSRAGEDHVSNDYATYIGYNTAAKNISGRYNTAVGSQASFYNTEGESNVIIGFQANFRNTGGQKNTIMGYQAGHGGSTFFDSDANVFIGYQAGYFEQGSNKLYIDNNSTTEPLIYGEFNNNELEINGDLTIDVPVGSAESRAEIKFGYQNSPEYTIDYDGSNDKFEIREGNTQVMIIQDYNIGIKRTPTTNDLEVSGTASKSSAGDWLANSDARLKKNIKPLNSSLVLSKLLQLQGITYEWNDKRQGYDRPKGEQYGFTAQNIEEVFPELVTTDNEGYLQTSYGTYDAMYIEAIRALCEKIELLENRVKMLESDSNLHD